MKFHFYNKVEETTLTALCKVFIIKNPIFESIYFLRGELGHKISLDTDSESGEVNINIYFDMIMRPGHPLLMLAKVNTFDALVHHFTVTYNIIQ